MLLGLLCKISDWPPLWSHYLLLLQGFLQVRTWLELWILFFCSGRFLSFSQDCILLFFCSGGSLTGSGHQFVREAVHFSVNLDVYSFIFRKVSCCVNRHKTLSWMQVPSLSKVPGSLDTWVVGTWMLLLEIKRRTSYDNCCTSFVRCFQSHRYCSCNTELLMGYSAHVTVVVHGFVKSSLRS